MILQNLRGMLSNSYKSCAYAQTSVRLFQCFSVSRWNLTEFEAFYNYKDNHS